MSPNNFTHNKSKKIGQKLSALSSQDHKMDKALRSTPLARRPLPYGCRTLLKQLFAGQLGLAFLAAMRFVTSRVGRSTS